ncbi:MAG: YdiY family protein [Wenzhouxiangella sp.]
MQSKFLWAGVILLASSAQAEFSGTGEFGLVFNRGNSESEAANARLEMLWDRGHWENEATATAVYARDSGATSANRFALADTLNYKLSERSFVGGSLRYDRDQFSSFRYQASVAAGYGYRILTGETHRLTVEGGPGYQFAEIRDTGETDNQAILRGRVNYRWQISESTRLTNRLLVEAGSKNTFAENGLGLTVAVNSRVSLGSGVTVRHNTDVEPGRKKTDTLTTLTVTYNFGAHKD